MPPATQEPFSGLSSLYSLYPSLWVTGLFLSRERDASNSKRQSDLWQLTCRVFPEPYFQLPDTYSPQRTMAIASQLHGALAHSFLPAHVCLLCTCFVSHWASMHHVSTRIFCSWGVMNATCRWGNKTIEHTHCTYFLGPGTVLFHWTSLTKHKFKDKTIMNFKMAVTEHWTKPGALCDWVWPCVADSSQCLPSQPPFLLYGKGKYVFWVQIINVLSSVSVCPSLPWS